MLTNPWIDPRVLRLSVEQIKTNLLARGWQQRPFANPNVLAFGWLVDDEGGETIQVLPVTERMSDYPQRVIELVGAVAALEGRWAGDVITDMLLGVPAPALNGTPPAHS